MSGRSHSSLPGMHVFFFCFFYVAMLHVSTRFTTVSHPTHLSLNFDLWSPWVRHLVYLITIHVHHVTNVELCIYIGVIARPDSRDLILNRLLAKFKVQSSFDIAQQGARGHTIQTTHIQSGDIQTHRVKVYKVHISSNEHGSCRQHAPNGLPIRP